MPHQEGIPNNENEIPLENAEPTNSEKESLPRFRRGDKIKLTPETVESWKRASLIGESSPTEGVVTDAKDDEQMAMVQVGYKNMAVSYKDIEKGEALETPETLKKGTRVRLTQEAIDRLEDSGMIDGFPATEGVVSVANDEGQMAAVEFKDRFKEASSVRQVSYKDLEKLDKEGGEATVVMPKKEQAETVSEDTEEMLIKQTEEFINRAKELGVLAKPGEDWLVSVEQKIIKAPKSEIGTGNYKKLIELYTAFKAVADKADELVRKEFEERSKKRK